MNADIDESDTEDMGGPEGRRSGEEIRDLIGIVTPAELAAALGVHIGTLKQWRYRKVGPKFTVGENRIYYRVDDLRDYFQRNVRSMNLNG